VKYDGSDEMDETLSMLQADVRNLQIHVTDIKGEVRATNAKIDSLRDKVEEYRVEDNKRIDARFEEARRETKAEFTAVRAETKAEFAAVRGEMKTEFAAVRGEMKTEFAAVRTEMQTGFAAVRKEMKTEFAAVRTEMQTGFAALRTEMQAGFSEARSAQRWFCGTLITIFIAGAGAMFGVIGHGFKWF
jgi:hypothetical protein